MNPTPWPELFRFLLGDDVRDDDGQGRRRRCATSTCSIVLDISDVKRLGALADTVRALDVPKLVIDHHIASDDPAGDDRVSPTSTACATGELVYDLACALDFEITPTIAQALYTAMLTDTGGFRFSNTTPRCPRHRRRPAARRRRSGGDVRPHLRVRARGTTASARRSAGTASASTRSTGSPGCRCAAGALEKYDVRQEDLDGIVEHARSIAGTRMALFFRDLGYGKVKVSFRSTGEVDVNAFARQFGGGGHAKASGALDRRFARRRARACHCRRAAISRTAVARGDPAHGIGTPFNMASTLQQRIADALGARSASAHRARRDRERRGSRHRDDNDGQSSAHAATRARRRSRARSNDSAGGRDRWMVSPT